MMPRTEYETEEAKAERLTKEAAEKKAAEIETLEAEISERISRLATLTEGA